jgi:hypothetical protein
MSEPSEAPSPEAEPPVQSAPPSVPAPNPAASEAGPDAQYRAAASAFRSTRYRPLLGPALVCFGAMLWAYVVLGDLVLAFGFPEAAAVLVLLVTFGASAHASGRQSLALLPPNPGGEARRLVLPGLAGFGFTLVTVLVVTAFAHAGRASADSPITLFLLATSFVAATYGYHLSGPSLNRPGGALRALSIAARVFGGLLTIIVVARTLVAWR